MAILDKRMRKPLSKKKIEAWIEANQERIVKEIGVNDWSIIIKVVGKGAYSLNQYWTDYKKATIRIVRECAWSYEHLEITFRHELCHLLVSPLTELEEKILPLLDYKSRTAVSRLLNSADERITENIVRLQQINKLCPPKKEECYYVKPEKR